MGEKPDEIISQWKPSPTGSDEMASILLKNSQDQMAAVALSMYSKQPKRAMISCEKGCIFQLEQQRQDGSYSLIIRKVTLIKCICL